MRLGFTLALAPVTLLLAGCYSFQGPERIVTKDARPANLRSSNIDMFVEDFKLAEAYRKQNPSAANPYVPQMLRSGFMYNYTFCENYFTQMGQSQRRSQIVRSALPPITALITGIIGLQNFSKNPGAKEDLITSLAIGSAATTAVLNIYDEHFLFGAENIGAVQVMALKAQDAHATKVFEQESITFERAMQHLIDNQGQCSPQSILSLARSVLKSAKLKATNEGSGNDGETAGGINTEGNGNRGEPAGKVTISPGS